MPTNTLDQLRAQGIRVTPIREALLKILTEHETPLTPQQILKKLAHKGFSANKTTVYRQLQSLARHNLVRAVNFDDRSNHYELVHEGKHHHHLICLKCGRVEDISLPTDLAVQEKNILLKHKFKVLRHSLEFFGFCKNCLKRKK